MSRRNIGERGLAIVCHYEGERNPKCGWDPVAKVYRPYKDPVGIWTIGLGTIVYPNGKRVSAKDKPIDEMEANYLMNFELDEKEDAVVTMARKMNLNLLDCEFDALVSMAYNCGVGILDSDSSVRLALATGDKAKIKAAFMLYVKGTKTIFGFKRKVTLPGLVFRRQTEYNLFANGNVVFYN